MPENNFPKLHNASWPGVVGKGPDSEPPISIDTMIELTANAEVDGVKFDGFDLFVADPHLDIDSNDDGIKKMVDKARAKNLEIGSLVAPVWAGTGGGSAMGSREERNQFVTQVRKACIIGKKLRDLGIRPNGVIRIDSSVDPHSWAADPVANTKLIAQTFREACDVAADYGEALAAEGEICWGGMHGWKTMVNTLEAVDRPNIGFQADMAHTLLYLLGYNKEDERILPKDFDWSDRATLTEGLKTVTAALRPWTIDFHVAQNDGTVFGSGSHDKTGRHCQATDPNGKLDIAVDAGHWLRDENGVLTKKIRHICWDGCMFPNDVMMQPKTWNDILGAMIKVRQLHGWYEAPQQWVSKLDAIQKSLNSIKKNRVYMSSKKELRIGMVGYGFMGRTHSNAYRRVGNFFPELKYQPVLKAICGRNKERTQAFADQWGYESIETDWKKLIAREDIDAIDICTPNNMHAEIAIAAAEAGKMVLCEKPLARTVAEAQPMVDAIEKAGVPNTVYFNYRRLPSVTLAKQLIDAGKLGKIFHYRANFLQDWTISPELPQGGEGLWRLDNDAAGSGVTGDLLAHCIDTAMWLNGGIKDVSAMTETFIKERVHTGTGEKQEVTIDDACMFHCHFDNGSLGLFESTRYARGHKALYTFEINGEHASIKWNLHDLSRLEYFDHRDESQERGWRSIHVTDGDHPYMDKWWVPGLSIGYEHSFVHQIADFLKALEEGKPCSPTFKEAQETQKVCEAVLESARTKSWKDTGVKW